MISTFHIPAERELVGVFKIYMRNNGNASFLVVVVALSVNY